MNNAKILNLFKECNFDHLNYETVDEDILDFLPENFKYEWRAGASKVVIIPDNKNYVIKIPFKGTYYYDSPEESFLKFQVPGLSTQHEFDHCAKELIIYSKAKKNHVSEILLKNFYLGNINGEPIYIQQKVNTFNEYYGEVDIFDDSSIHTEEEVESMEKSYEKSSIWLDMSRAEFKSWLTDVHQYYGEKKFIKFIQFINDYISDLHAENIGYIGDKPIIIDYASYYG